MSASTKTKFVEDSLEAIDELTNQVNDNRDYFLQQVSDSDSHSDIKKLQSNEIKRRTDEIIEGLRAFRTAVVRNEVSEDDVADLSSWFKVFLKSIKGYLGLSKV